MKKLSTKKVVVISIAIVVLIVIIGLILFLFNKKTLKGVWVADGTQIQYILSVDEVADENPDPYYLTIEDDKKFTLELSKKTVKGEYSVLEDDKISFTADGIMPFECELKNESELHCNAVASIFTRKK